MSLALAPNYGFELPEFSHKDVLHNKDLMRRQTKDHFIRRICVGIGFEELSLKEALDIADREFELAARYCGAIVVKHEWGIAKRQHTTNRLNMTRNNNLLPNSLPKSFGLDGYQLVAKVEKVKPSLCIPESANQELRQGIDNYAYMQSTTNWRYWDLDNWNDDKNDQFVYGTSVSQPQDLYHLTDLDLFIYKRT